MTALEKLKNEHPEYINDKGDSTVCPMFLDYLPKPDGCGCSVDCDDCWAREIPEIPEKIVDALCEVGTPNPVSPEEVRSAMTIKDSGTRREFETGAVRDIQEGKGRCDLLPLTTVGEFIRKRKSNEDAQPILCIAGFTGTNDIDFLYCALQWFGRIRYEGEDYEMLLEVAKHFEDGAKKYGEYNWQKGIPTHCYVDSAVRHYLKYLRGDTDEPHDRAFVWNILCCIWTCKHKPELNDYARAKKMSTTIIKEHSAPGAHSFGPAQEEDQ